MEQHVGVELIPHTVDRPDAPAIAEAQRNLAAAYEQGSQGAVQRAQDDLADVMKQAAHVEWSARINGGVFPVEAFGVEHVDGRVLVSLVVAADAVSVGRSPAGTPAPGDTEKKVVSTWGDPSLPDPRESLPGWVRPVSAQVASNTVGRLV